MWDKINRYHDISVFECLCAVVFVLLCRHWRFVVGGLLFVIIAWFCGGIYG